MKNQEVCFLGFFSNGGYYSSSSLNSANKQKPPITVKMIWVANFKIVAKLCQYNSTQQHHFARLRKVTHRQSVIVNTGS